MGAEMVVCMFICASKDAQFLRFGGTPSHAVCLHTLVGLFSHVYFCRLTQK